MTARARDHGIPLDGRPGPHNAITDVDGVEVGYVTLIEGEGPLRVGAGPVRTGVTALLPRGRAGADRVCAAGWSTLNGNGEMTGTTWIQEAGTVRSPVLITNTHAVGPCHQGTVAWMVQHHPAVARQWMLPVVAETWDGYLNDINGAHVSAEHAVAAIDAARSGPVAEGSVGGGTGMTCYGFKGGSGTASRVVEVAGAGHTVAVFVQANFGRRDELVIAGVPVGRALADDDPEGDPAWLAPPGAGSVIVVIATDAPLLPGQCQALARRAPMGLARTGTTGSHYSGDIFLALSTADADGLTSRLSVSEPAAAPGSPYATIAFLAWEHIDPLYEAVAQATEEAVLNALVAAETMIGRDDHRSPALPTAALAGLLSSGR
ncbi:MAG TPA: P1 family peptidase [Solirubrobacteraceae bacterium]|nr:P1 family peptidase [Solirubrobacteraceae bacterium]